MLVPTSKIAIFLAIMLVLVLLYLYTNQGEIETLRIGYLPIYPDAQFLIAYELGWFDELKEYGVDNIEFIKFEQGAAMIQAFAAGELDVLYVGIDPVLVGLERGLRLKVVAANIINPLALIGKSELADYYEEHGSRFLEVWKNEKGRPARIATLPKGTTPDILLRITFLKLGYDPNNPPVDVLPMGVAGVRAALLNGEVDAAMIMEPIITIATEEEGEFEVIIPGNLILEGHPGAVLAVSQDLINTNPDIVRKLVELHVKATKFLNTNAKEAARLLSNAIGPSILPYEVALEALESPMSNFISDPRLIINGTMEYHKFRATFIGTERDLQPSDIFDTRFFEEVAVSEQ